MKPERANRSSPAHLTVVTSMMHAGVDIAQWESWSTEKNEGVMAHLNRPENFPGGSAMYAHTKLLAEYALRELAERMIGPDGR
jgi:hypothetical protein